MDRKASILKTDIPGLKIGLIYLEIFKGHPSFFPGIVTMFFTKDFICFNWSLAKWMLCFSMEIILIAQVFFSLYSKVLSPVKKLLSYTAWAADPSL